MAAVPITIIGIQTDEQGSRNVTITGMASITGLGVGGGPITPPPAKPTHPIVLPGDPSWGSDPHPTHPIVLPDPPVEPPTGEADEDGFIKPPPENGGWAYHEDHGWLYSPGPGAAGPKS
jgi:hypothetical protein